MSMKRAERLLEVEDDADVVKKKVGQLAQMMRESKLTLVYTGAGISTAANIPDYRGPNGVWTLAEQGQQAGCRNILQSSPTLSHLVLKELYRHGKINHILSQNCDGLHLRSGLPQKGLSEIHGNMHIEVCTRCDNRQYIRPFDVTEDSGFRKHGTKRNCVTCGSQLRDTIVHFGEHGKLPFPLHWKGTTEHVEEADLIVCIGTSLAVLKDYTFLWPEPDSETKIVIINLQWTPKDKVACLKINAKCDDVLGQLTDQLQIPIRYYCRECDPVLAPRRSSRVNELMNKLTDCSCHVRAPRTASEVVQEEHEKMNDKTPGWWSAGLTMAARRFKKEVRRKNSADETADTEMNNESIVKKLMRDMLNILDPLPEENLPQPSTSAEVPVKRKRGRPRKYPFPSVRAPPPPKVQKRIVLRSVSSDEDDEDPSDSEISDEGDSSDPAEEYQPQYHQRRTLNAAAPVRSTRSSGTAEAQPLVGSFRKRRKDIGKKRGKRRRKYEEAELSDNDEEDECTPGASSASSSPCGSIDLDGEQGDARKGRVAVRSEKYYNEVKEESEEEKTIQIPRCDIIQPNLIDDDLKEDQARIILIEHENQEPELIDDSLDETI